MFDKWADKAEDFNKLMGTRFKVDSLLESIPGLKQGADLADYLVKFDVRTFTSQPPAPAQAVKREIISFEIQAVIPEMPINWYNGRLLPSMQQNDFTETISWYN
jgi:hypothetical protein